MNVHLPASLPAALDLLAADPTAVPVAGGTDLLVHWPNRLAEHDRRFIDLSGLSELKGVRWRDDVLELGGLTTYWDIIVDRRARQELPLLVAAARQIGSIQIQTRGTWAGNVVNASPAADGVPVLMAYDAVVVLESRRGREEMPLAQFFTGYKATRRTPDQLVVALRIPRRRYTRQIFEKVGSRRAQAIAKVGVAVTQSAEGWRVVAASVAPTVRRCTALEARLEQSRPLGAPSDLHDAIVQDVTPIDDIRSTAEYRTRVLARVLYAALSG